MPEGGNRNAQANGKRRDSFVISDLLFGDVPQGDTLRAMALDSYELSENAGRKATGRPPESRIAAHNAQRRKNAFAGFPAVIAMLRLGYIK
jgi:hypothetical protein